MSSLTRFLIRDLPRRILERALGLIVLTIASYLFLDENVFVKVIVPLGIVDLYIGFLMPTLQAIGVAGKGNQENRVFLFCILFLCASFPKTDFNHFCLTNSLCWDII